MAILIKLASVEFSEPSSVSVKELIVKERILLHLFDYSRFANEYEAPVDVTQKAIAQATGISVHHVSQYVKPLVAEELVVEKTSHVRKRPRRAKVYFLTAHGRHKAASLRYARVLAARGREERARQILTEALADFQERGRKPLVEEVEQALRALESR